MADPWDTPEGQTHYVDDGCPGGHRESFDYHASIMRLAEAEITPLAGVPYPSHLMVNTATGNIVPFASLRTPCLRPNHHSYLDLPGGCPSCQNRAWVPEPDVEKACHRVRKWLDQHGTLFQDTDGWHFVPTGVPEPFWVCRGSAEYEEAVLRAAEAWLGETP